MTADDEFKPPPPPRILGVRGRRLWKDIQLDNEFDPRETNLLTEVCRNLDTIDALAASVEADGVMVLGSQGQQVLNPAVAELRQQQASFARLVAMLNLSALDDAVPLLNSGSSAAQAAANARWRGVRRA